MHQPFAVQVAQGIEQGKQYGAQPCFRDFLRPWCGFAQLLSGFDERHHIVVGVQNGEVLQHAYDMRVVQTFENGDFHACMLQGVPVVPLESTLGVYLVVSPPEGAGGGQVLFDDHPALQLSVDGFVSDAEPTLPQGAKQSELQQDGVVW